jgi:hypothetical protein
MTGRSATQLYLLDTHTSLRSVISQKHNLIFDLDLNRAYYFAVLSILFFNVKKCYKFVNNFGAFAHFCYLENHDAYEKSVYLWYSHLLGLGRFSVP